LAGVYEELGSTNLEPLSLSLLLSHSVLHEVVSSCTTYKAVVSCSLLFGTKTTLVVLVVVVVV